MNRLSPLILTACLALVSSWAQATSYVPPQDRTILSPNNKFELKIHAKTEIHRVRRNGGLHRVMWRFKRTVWHDEYYLGSDGAHVAWVSWADAGPAHEAAVIIYGAAGEVAKVTFGEIGDMRRYRRDEVGPIGRGRRIWKESEIRIGEIVEITTPTKKVIVDLAKGTIKIGR